MLDQPVAIAIIFLSLGFILGFFLHAMTDKD